MPAEKTNQGFSLIEMCIILIVSGILITTLSVVYFQHISGRHLAETRKALNTAQSAMTEYRGRLGVYPCPADPEKGPGDAGFGEADCGLAPVNGRDADGNGQPDKILIGAIPYNSMQPILRDVDLSAGNTIDGWGRKLTYAVTLSLTDPVSYNDYHGAIAVEDENAKSVLNEPGTAHLILISHGNNGRGAYMPSGTLVQNCVISTPVIPPPPAPPPAPPMAHNETENCDNDGTFLDGLRYADEFSYNDDLAKYLITQVSSLWSYTGGIFVPPTSTNLVLQVANSNPGYVGIGVVDPVEPLHIAGSIQAEQLEVDKFCDTSGLDCMSPETIGGEVPDMQCEPGKAITKIEDENARAYCEPIFTAATAGTCPAGQAMIGISTTGVLCAPTP